MKQMQDLENVTGSMYVSSREQKSNVKEISVEAAATNQPAEVTGTWGEREQKQKQQQHSTTQHTDETQFPIHTHPLTLSFLFTHYFIATVVFLPTPPFNSLLSLFLLLPYSLLFQPGNLGLIVYAVFCLEYIAGIGVAIL
ncbi:hypothetical protein GQ457_07G026590 [Hibiscus cannabinus]